MVCPFSRGLHPATHFFTRPIAMENVAACAGIAWADGWNDMRDCRHIATWLSGIRQRLQSAIFCSKRSVGRSYRQQP